MAMTGSPAGPQFEQPFIGCCRLMVVPAIAEQPRAAIGNGFAMWLEIERSARAVDSVGVLPAVIKCLAQPAIKRSALIGGKRVTF